MERTGDGVADVDGGGLWSVFGVRGAVGRGFWSVCGVRGAVGRLAGEVASVCNDFVVTVVSCGF